MRRINGAVLRTGTSHERVHQCARNHSGISGERRKTRFRRAQIRREKSFPDREISGELLKLHSCSASTFGQAFTIVAATVSHAWSTRHLFARFFQTHNGGAGSKRRCARLRASWRELRAARQKERSARFGLRALIFTPILWDDSPIYRLPGPL